MITIAMPPGAATTALSFNGGTSNSGTSSFYVPFPTGTQVGTLLVAAYAGGETGVTLPAGWTVQINDTSTGNTYAVVTKYAAAGDATPTFVPNSSFGGCAVLLGFQGASPTIGATTSSPNVNKSAKTYTPTAMTITTVPDMIVRFAANAVAGTTFTWDAKSTDAADSSTQASLTSSYQYLKTAGSTGTSTATASQSVSNGWQGAITVQSA